MTQPTTLEFNFLLTADIWAYRECEINLNQNMARDWQKNTYAYSMYPPPTLAADKIDVWALDT